ncbi:MAG TPA: DUF6178 family protein, partial [Polyangiaceae bacterium]|nr:DUF6178 family protein [Polyangiaceae bacterium]
ESRALVATADGPVLKLALAALAERDPALHAERAEELAYLTNVIVAGDTASGGRAYRPIEALERALTLTNVGLEQVLAARDARLAPLNPKNPAHVAAACDVVTTTHLDRLFRLGLRRRET